jgi:hypothetical protein
MKPPEPLAKFRVYPEYRSLYYTVFIWRNLHDLRTFNPGNSDTLGLCRTHLVVRFQKNQPDRTLPSLGQVHLSKNHLRIGIISHEFTHAAIGWASRTRIVPDFTPIRDGEFLLHGAKSPEERFCYVLGNMVKDCVRKLYHLKILR